MSRNKRELESYLESARELATVIPSLKKYKKRKTLRPAEKAAIARKEKIFRETYTSIDNLIPLSKSQARELKDVVFQPETLIRSGPRKGQTMRHHFVQAIQLRNTGRDTKIIKKLGSNIVVVSNGRTWVYWKLPNVKPSTLEEYGEAAFETPEEFDIERVLELAKKAFQQPETKGIYLWGDKGRVGSPFPTFKQFARWIIDDYQSYTNTEKWVNGIAILVADVNERISDREWNSFGRRTEDKEQASAWRKRNRKRRNRK